MGLHSDKTRKSPTEVLSEAKDYFGEEGLGLSRSREDACFVVFEGGRGARLRDSFARVGLPREVVHGTCLVYRGMTFMETKKEVRCAA